MIKDRRCIGPTRIKTCLHATAGRVNSVCVDKVPVLASLTDNAISAHWPILSAYKRTGSPHWLRWFSFTLFFGTFHSRKYSMRLNSAI